MRQQRLWWRVWGWKSMGCKQEQDTKKSSLAGGSYVGERKNAGKNWASVMRTSATPHLQRPEDCDQTAKGTFCILKLKSSVLAKSFIISDSWNTAEAGRAFLQQWTDVRPSLWSMLCTTHSPLRGMKKTLPGKFTTVPNLWQGLYCPCELASATSPSFNPCHLPPSFTTFQTHWPSLYGHQVLPAAGSLHALSPHPSAFNEFSLQRIFWFVWRIPAHSSRFETNITQWGFQDSSTLKEVSSLRSLSTLSFASNLPQQPLCIH